MSSMGDIAIRVEGLGKQYRIGRRERYKTLRESIMQGLAVPYRRLQSVFQQRQRQGVERRWHDLGTQRRLVRGQARRSARRDRP